MSKLSAVLLGDAMIPSCRIFYWSSMTAIKDRRRSTNRVLRSQGIKRNLFPKSQASFFARKIFNLWRGKVLGKR